MIGVGCGVSLIILVSFIAFVIKCSRKRGITRDNTVNTTALAISEPNPAYNIYRSRESSPNDIYYEEVDDVIRAEAPPVVDEVDGVAGDQDGLGSNTRMISLTELYDSQPSVM
jgi:hypothetical protein